MSQFISLFLSFSVEIRAYKVLCWDPDDQVIVNAASLKSGVSNEVKLSSQLGPLAITHPLSDSSPQSIQMQEMSQTINGNVPNYVNDKISEPLSLLKVTINGAFLSLSSFFFLVSSLRRKI